MANNNPWSYWLEDYPSALYQAMIPKNVSPTFMDYWRGQSGNVWSQYQGALAEQALAGEPPSLGFGDFLGKDWPFMKKWWNLSPQQRGVNYGQFAPSLRWRV